MSTSPSLFSIGRRGVRVGDLFVMIYRGQMSQWGRVCKSEEPQRYPFGVEWHPPQHEALFGITADMTTAMFWSRDGKVLLWH